MKLAISRTGAFVSICLVACCYFGSLLLERRLVQNNERNFQITSLPNHFGDWEGAESEKLSERSADILRLDQYVRRIYTNSKKQSVFVYIGYWKKQSGEYQAAKHSPLMCLPANGWKISRPEPIELVIGSEPNSRLQIARKISGKLRENSSLFYYWFFSGEKSYIDETEALFYIMKETILHGRSDGGIIEISTDIGAGANAEHEAEEIMRSFINDFSPIFAQQIGQK